MNQLALDHVVDSPAHGVRYFTPGDSPDTAAIATACSPSGTTENVSISNVFHPNLAIGFSLPDIKFVTADNVLFFAHVAHLLSRSENHLNGLIPTQEAPCKRPAPPAIAVPEPSIIFNIVLHTIYGWSCSAFAQSVDTLSAAVASLKVYGVPATTSLAPHTPLHALLLAHATLRPLEVYTLAAEHAVEHLAVAVSTQLLSRSICDLPEPLILRMGARYLLRLARLQLSLVEKLRDLVLTPPDDHLPMSSCSSAQSRALLAAWAHATAKLSWHARPDLPASVIQAVFHEVEAELTCSLCKDALRSRVKYMLYQWTLARRTI